MPSGNYEAPAQFGAGKLEPFADSVWTATTPIRFAGIWFPHVMSVIGLGTAGLLLHSPCQPSTSLLSNIANLGKVAHIVAPNWFHDLYLVEYRSLYPDATFWGPPMLRCQRGSAIVDSDLGQTSRTPWFEEMPHFTLSGLLTLDESIFFHTVSRTLIVADLFTNVCADASAPPFTRFAYSISAIDGRLTMFPYLRWFGFTARRSLRMAAQRILAWNPQRVIVGHGTPIASNAAEQLRAGLQGLMAPPKGAPR